MKTYFPKVEEIKKKWYLIDAQNKVLGRLAAKIAVLLTGKNKPLFTPSMDCGDYAVVINAAKIRLSGKKLKEKVYSRHSGYPQGAKYISAEKLLKEHPERMLRFAVKGMLPKSKLGSKLLTKLKIYAGENHPHSAQQLEELKI